MTYEHAEYYIGAVICNIKCGVGERSNIIYAEIRDSDGELLVSALLGYCVQRMIDVAEALRGGHAL